jgi:hypothetical protein
MERKNVGRREARAHATHTHPSIHPVPSIHPSCSNKFEKCRKEQAVFEEKLPATQ